MPLLGKKTLNVTFPPGTAQQHACQLHTLVSELLLAREVPLKVPADVPAADVPADGVPAAVSAAAVLAADVPADGVSAAGPTLRDLLERALSSTGSSKFPSQLKGCSLPYGTEDGH